MRRPLVSVIVTTRNNCETIDACLLSIKSQDYPEIELVVVDNFSTDGTAEIAKQYTEHVYSLGPERSAQRNYAVEVASGMYVVIIDSDMELTPHVIGSCVAKMQAKPALGGLIIPEESFGQGFWAQCKKLERSFYVGVDWIEAARFFRKDIYQKAGGYDCELVSGEDWDLSRRVQGIAPIDRVSEFIQHNEGRLNLVKTLRKKYYYAGLAGAYLQKNQVSSKMTNQLGPLQRYALFFSRPGKLIRHPIIAMGMLFMKTCEFGCGGLGYVVSRRKKSATIETETANE
ncbi:MAG TPA: glycosyltransferase [Candidatus Saccharimonadales bacterium]|nr:glycosyltransferase [Candidatus Saccharimonadales bacterium]